MTHPQRLAALFDTAECQSAIEAAEPLRESSRQLAHRPLALALDLASYPALNLETYVIRAGKDAVVYETRRLLPRRLPQGVPSAT